MSLVYTPDLKDLVRGQFLLMDTCTIIDASKCKEVYNTIVELKNEDCTLISLPAVKEEFLCSANNTKEYHQLADFVKAIDILFINNIDNILFTDIGERFTIALNRCKNIKPSYVDRSLLAIPYFYSEISEKVLIITSNHKDVPEELFDRVGFISHDTGGFHNIGIYEFDESKFRKITSDYNK